MNWDFVFTRRAGLPLVTVFIVYGLSGCLTSSGSAPAPTLPGDGPGSGNHSPDISGNPPAAITIDSNYLFEPRATDPDGDTLTFSIQNKPDWASFDPATGKLSGVATAGTEGVYANIRITVTDGQESDSTPAFSIEVTQSALGSVTLSWTAPTHNEDGSPLVDLAGFRIYFGTQSGSYGNSIEIDNPGVVTYVVENLSPNTYYFASTAFNSAGSESDFSSEAQVTIGGS